MGWWYKAAMLRLASILLAALFLMPASAAAAEGSGLNKLVQLKLLRCDALQRAKLAKQKSDIYRSDALHATPIRKIQLEEMLSREEQTAGQAFDEAGNLKRSLERQADAFTSSQRMAWYKTNDLAKRIKIEELIAEAQRMLESGCGD
jgi:hypothetical protein